MNCPPAPFQHLRRMTDEVGLLEHAKGIVPRYEQGYGSTMSRAAWSWCAGSQRRPRNWAPSRTATSVSWLRRKLPTADSATGSASTGLA